MIAWMRFQGFIRLLATQVLIENHWSLMAVARNRNLIRLFIVKCVVLCCAVLLQ